MRPTRNETDLEFWMNARHYWMQKVEFWMIESVQASKTNDPAWEAVCDQNRYRAQDKAEQAEWKRQEAAGEIIVYTGRARPRWA